MTRPAPVADLDAAPAAPQAVVLALGANLGDREATLVAAVRDLAAAPGLGDVCASPVYETAPVGGPAQPAYLNAVLTASTTLSPRGLLRVAQQVEAAYGRERDVRWGPRTLDVDVVVYADLVATDDALTLPHPRAAERAFVLVPWAALDPGAVLPGPGGGPVAELAAAASASAGGVGLREDLRLPATPDGGNR